MSTTALFATGVFVTVIVGAGLSLLVYGAILDGRYAAEQKRRAARKNIVETAREAGSFSTLLAALDTAGLDGTLAEGGPYTVFAPTDEAFARLPAGTVESLLADRAKLTWVLTYHVVPGRVSAADAGRLAAVGADVVSADIEASNGLIHVIDRVLLPAAA